jgi:hypothetical protein
MKSRLDAAMKLALTHRREADGLKIQIIELETREAHLRSELAKLRNKAA